MFTKFRNRTPEDLGIFFVIVIFILLLPLLLLITLIFEFIPSKERRVFNENYEKFLNSHEGDEFFCYTNREKSVSIIEKELLPEIENSVHIIKLIGKEPITVLKKQYISHALYNLKNVGFPNVMKVIDGKMVDFSLHKKTYDAINNKKLNELKNILDNGFVQIRTKIKNET